MDIINEKNVDMTFDEFCRGGKSITPGPWEASQAIRHGYTVYSKAPPNYESIVGCEDEEGRYGAVRFAADACLIAAAPELLDALKDMHGGWKYIRETHGDLYGVGWDRAQKKAEAAIAKAEGRS
jgi:hypothetical protein